MAYEIKEFPPLSWSFSRMKMLQECPRRYFFNYYAYHNGWLQDADEESKQIYRLKNLQPIDAYFGQTFHGTIKGVTQNRKKEYISPDAFRRLINRTIKSAYQESLNSMDEWLIHPKWFVMMSEVYYEGDIPQEKKDTIIDKVNVVSKNVFASQSFKELTENDDVEIIELDELKSFEVKGITAYVKIDAFYRVGNKFVIADWKTGRESLKDVDQLILYAWYAHRVLGIRLEDIEARLEYIGQEKAEVYNFGEDILELVERRLKNDLKLINKYLINPDTNQPLPKESFFQAKGSLFCKYCNFREAC